MRATLKEEIVKRLKGVQHKRAIADCFELVYDTLAGEVGAVLEEGEEEIVIAEPEVENEPEQVEEGATE